MVIAGRRTWRKLHTHTLTRAAAQPSFTYYSRQYKALTQGLVHKDTPNLHTATSQRQPSMELTDKEYLAWHLKVARDSHAEGVAALATGRQKGTIPQALSKI